jgi:hypothetical protein
MKRFFLVAVTGASVLLAACSSGHPTELNGKLSANTRNADEFTAAARKGSTTTRVHRRTTTTRRTNTTRPAPTTPTRPSTTFPSTPPTMARTGVAGVVLYETDCSADRPCSLKPGPAKLALLDSAGNVVASGNTRDNGSFILGAAPGNYTLHAKPTGKKQQCAPVPVTVTSNGYTSARITCGAKS